MLDPQLKRGLLDHCVLAALCRGDSYGYQLVKDMSDQRESNSKAHERLWDKNDEQDKAINDHETRITTLERK